MLKIMNKLPNIELQVRPQLKQHVERLGKSEVLDLIKQGPFDEIRELFSLKTPLQTMSLKVNIERYLENIGDL